MFGPLNFPQESSEPLAPPDENPVEAVCILCPHRCASHNELLTHIFVEHKLVIGDVPLIADLKLYLDYWRMKLAHVAISHVCTGIQMHGDLYYLLSDVLPEDRILREGLHIKRLEAALSQQAVERSDTSYSAPCMFCRHVISPTRAVYIQHLADQHNVQLGPVDTLVYIDKLLTVVMRQIDNLLCLFCERTYRTRDILKEHMRKKGHKRLNPHNEMYDEFYIDSYRDMSRSWKNRKWPRPSSSSHSSCSSTSLEVPETAASRNSSAAASDEEDEVDSDWSDWAEADSVKLVCLFCDVSMTEWEKILLHMRSEHGFQFQSAVRGLDFYKQVKLVNFIRREIYWNSCPVCREKYDTRQELYGHIKSSGHAQLPEESFWNCPEYFFPTYENDGFLYQLDDGEDVAEVEGNGEDGDKPMPTQPMNYQVEVENETNKSDQLLTPTKPVSKPINRQVELENETNKSDQLLTPTQPVSKPINRQVEVETNKSDQLLTPTQPVSKPIDHQVGSNRTMSNLATPNLTTSRPKSNQGTSSQPKPFKSNKMVSTEPQPDETSHPPACRAELTKSDQSRPRVTQAEFGSFSDNTERSREKSGKSSIEKGLGNMKIGQ